MPVRVRLGHDVAERAGEWALERRPVRAPHELAHAHGAPGARPVTDNQERAATDVLDGGGEDEERPSAAFHHLDGTRRDLDEIRQERSGLCSA